VAARSFVRSNASGGRWPGQAASHIIMTRPGEIATLSVPDHREVARGTLRSLLRAAGVSVREFVEATK